MGRYLEGMGMVTTDLIEFDEVDFFVIDDKIGIVVCGYRENACQHLTRDEAIAAAKAILKHFDVDYNAYEDNLSNRYRRPNQDELKKFYEENPHIIPIPAHIYDPDAPLTSELMK